VSRLVNDKEGGLITLSIASLPKRSRKKMSQ
jgi:hypothetical protein